MTALIQVKLTGRRVARKSLVRNVGVGPNGGCWVAPQPGDKRAAHIGRFLPTNQTKTQWFGPFQSQRAADEWFAEMGDSVETPAAAVR